MRRTDWYKHAWSLDIKNSSWTEDTENQVNFIIQTLELTGKERILDLACGYGRHSLSLARKGFLVTGVDITEAYIADAMKTATEQNLSAKFIHSDIRDIRFEEEFDVVLNLADGAIGYLENDDENLKIFNVIVKALKYGGKHFMDLCNADHAERYFPKTNWEIGEKSLALAKFDWNPITRQMTYAGRNIPYGEPAQKPNINMEEENPYRLYSLDEVKDIFNQRGMKIISTFSNYYGREATDKEIQLVIYSQKQ